MHCAFYLQSINKNLHVNNRYTSTYATYIHVHLIKHTLNIYTVHCLRPSQRKSIDNIRDEQKQE